MFTVLGAVVVVLLAAVAVRVIFRDRFRSVPDQALPGTVLLVPGYGGNTAARSSNSPTSSGPPAGPR